MLRVVEFFVAPDDGASALVGPKRQGHGFPAFRCADFYPDDAVEDWEVLLVGGVASDSRVVVPMKCDGFMVFELSERLCSALAAASRARLVEVAVQWVELAEAKDGAPAEIAAEILTAVAGLARTAGDLGQSLYCWYFAP
ncbi:hypothetical protein [Streptomyces sp. NPDC096339]|uniref:hypothetical protein n=1 Tax=Streptomyces sp. NPDC096339 TaxID=3366086 RepID=UPI0037FF0C4B